MGFGSIPYTSIDTYARRHGFDHPDEFALLLAAVRACDAPYLQIMRKRTET